MRIRMIVLATLALSTTVLAQACRCAVYGGRMSGSSNCGFSTWNRCMGTVSEIGGFCQRNSFYNPRASASRSRKRAYYNY